MQTVSLREPESLRQTATLITVEFSQTVCHLPPTVNVRCSLTVIGTEHVKSACQARVSLLLVKITLDIGLLHKSVR